jgi:glutathione synthase/RimK-type ligase-like ATP-grasp enzyme
MLLIQGGALDPNIARLHDAACARGLAPLASLTRADHVPRLRWDLETDVLEHDGTPVAPTAAFIRYNVFTRTSAAADPAGGGDSFRAQAWFAAWQGWIAAHPDVRVFNRVFGQATTNKPEHLVRARRCGLTIPATVVTNDVRAEDLAAAEWRIAKPVAGGGYAHTLADALGSFPAGTRTLPAPALLQRRLVQPETRVFVVGRRTFAFSVVSSALDYREDAGTDVTTTAVPPTVEAPLLALAASLGLDFAAADFKTDAGTGRPVFLEINSQPMFARFDAASEGALVGAMLDWLVAT